MYRLKYWIIYLFLQSTSQQILANSRETGEKDFRFISYQGKVFIILIFFSNISRSYEKMKFHRDYFKVIWYTSIHLSSFLHCTRQVFIYIPYSFLCTSKYSLNMEWSLYVVFFITREKCMKAKRELKKTRFKKRYIVQNCRSDISKNSIKITSFIYIYIPYIRYTIGIKKYMKADVHLRVCLRLLLFSSLKEIERRSR